MENCLKSNCTTPTYWVKPTYLSFPSYCIWQWHAGFVLIDSMIFFYFHLVYWPSQDHDEGTFLDELMHYNSTFFLNATIPANLHQHTNELGLDHKSNGDWPSGHQQISHATSADFYVMILVPACPHVGSRWLGVSLGYLTGCLERYPVKHSGLLGQIMLDIENMQLINCLNLLRNNLIQYLCAV